LKFWPYSKSLRVSSIKVDIFIKNPIFDEIKKTGVTMSDEEIENVYGKTNVLPFEKSKRQDKK